MVSLNFFVLLYWFTVMTKKNIFGEYLGRKKICLKIQVNHKKEKVGNQDTTTFILTWNGLKSHTRVWWEYLTRTMLLQIDLFWKAPGLKCSFLFERSKELSEAGLQIEDCSSLSVWSGILKRWIKTDSQSNAWKTIYKWRTFKTTD